MEIIFQIFGKREGGHLGFFAFISSLNCTVNFNNFKEELFGEERDIKKTKR